MGLTQAETARFLGVRPHLASEWFAQYGTDVILRNRVCAHCGKAFEGMNCRSNRKYGSRRYSSKAAYLRKYPNPKFMRFDPEFRAEGLELYRDGLEGTASAAQRRLMAKRTRLSLFAKRFPETSLSIISRPQYSEVSRYYIFNI
jgi:hypothetical protein